MQCNREGKFLMPGVVDTNAHLTVYGVDSAAGHETLVRNGPRNHELAIEAYRKAIQVDPQNDIAHTELGELLQRMGKLQEAIAEYRRPPAQHLAPLDLIFAWPMRSKSKGVWMKLLLSIVRSLDSRLIGRMHILTWGTRSLPRETLTRRYLKWKKRCGYGRRTPMHTPVFAKLSVRRATLTAHSPNVAAH